MPQQYDLSPGAIKIDNIVIINHKGEGVNVKNIMISLSLHEDISSPFITGKLYLSDANSLFEKLPFIGEEMLIVDMETPGFDTIPLCKRSHTFHIYKIEGNEPVAIKNNVLGLCFASIEAFTDVNTRISKTFKGNITSVAKNIINNEPGLKSFKDAVVELTSNNIVYTSNYWTPSQNLYYLTSKALNSDSEPNYVFFENNEGFVFASLNSMYGAPTSMYFRNDQKTRKPNEPSNINEDYMTVLDISTPVFLDYFQRVTSGYYGSALYNYDIVTKRLNYRNFITSTDVKSNRLNQNSAFDEQRLQFKPEAALTLGISHKSLYDTSVTLPVDTFSRRMALLSNLSSHVTNIQVFGRLDYSVGRTIELLSYKNDETSEKDTDEELIDKVLSGKYLITALNHMITRESHLCNMEISKDSVLNRLIT